MIRWRDTLGRDVVDTSTAEGAGRVDGLVLDVDRGAITAIVVGGRVVSWADAEGIGTDAVTLRSSDLLSEPATEAERAAVSGTNDPLSKRVITDEGFEVGAVDDVTFDPDSGAIDRLLLGDDEVAGRRLLGVGSFAVVVAADDGSARQERAGSGGLQTMTKAELYDVASERDLAGRSRMNKQELLEALSETNSESVP